MQSATKAQLVVCFTRLPTSSPHSVNVWALCSRLSLFHRAPTSCISEKRSPTSRQRRAEPLSARWSTTSIPLHMPSEWQRTTGRKLKNPIMKTAVPPEIARLEQALRTAIEKSQVSHTEIERKLGMRPGKLTSIFSTRNELSVADLFGIPRAIGLDVWKVLVAGLRERNPEELNRMEKASYRLKFVLKVQEEICTLVVVGKCSFSIPGLTAEIPFQLLEAHMTREEPAPAETSPSETRKGFTRRRNSRKPTPP